MTYKINEIFYSLQGEGYHTGRPAVFIRFSGCNLECAWCDTDHSQFVEMTKDEIRHEVIELIRYPATNPTFHNPAYRPLIIFTGGEPTLQLDYDLIRYLRKTISFSLYCCETNGTRDVSKLNIDWVTFSPKAGTERQIVIREADEVKVVWPWGTDPLKYDDECFSRWYIQPLWVHNNPERTKEHYQKAIEFVMKNPQWKLSGQLHKFVGMP